ncbi:MAG: hypothetical protein ACRYGO_03695 [Janthinobacterium lividum]
MGMTDLDRKLQASLLAGRRVDGDRLVLADEVLLGALDGSRPLSAGERTALQASPLTARRLRTLAQQRSRPHSRQAPQASAGWRGSVGVLRAADSGAAFQAIVTEDGAWKLHVVGGRMILQLDPASVLAPALLRAGPALRVRDGAGNTVLEGRLDPDGECEGPWPFAQGAAQHFQQHGARFMVEPAVSPTLDPAGS